MAILIGLNAVYGQKATPFGTKDYVYALKQATDIMVNDVTSPVAAARYYSYITLAANETSALFDKQQASFSRTLKGFPPIIVDSTLIKKSDYGLATILAVYKSSSKLLPSGYLIKKELDSLINLSVKRKIPAEKITTSIALVDDVIRQLTTYVASDGFAKLSGLRKFTPAKGDEYWQPTAPAFMSALEPNWNTLRTFIIDSCSQFACPPPNKYSTDTTSSFYREMKEVYEVGKNLSKEQYEIAMFWDCNPFALQQMGHLEFGLKKISPGGHWMGITGIACKKQKSTLSKTTYVHTIVALTIADAFISCWDEKYKHNRVRPVTAIKKLIDQNWTPLLQTPPFPEYTSGHSVISTAAATVLTHLFGDHFSFSDDTEQEFGLPVRHFESFNDAAKEAAISRLYGGIHFRDAIANGAKEGEQIGKFIISRFTDKPIDNKHHAKTVLASVKNHD